jgi:enoyl-[acyl-carrier protein] reductase/trans-2-enoyl-CoA reductase (NAD+)
MKAQGTHEDCIEQMDRLFRDRLCSGHPQPDETGRLRLDDWEMAPSVQEPVGKNWQAVTTENLAELADFDGYQSSFLRLFGFGLPGVDYTAETIPDVPIPSIPATPEA